MSPVGSSHWLLQALGHNKKVTPTPFCSAVLFWYACYLFGELSWFSQRSLWVYQTYLELPFMCRLFSLTLVVSIAAFQTPLRSLRPMVWVINHGKVKILFLSEVPIVSTSIGVDSLSWSICLDWIFVTKSLKSISAYAEGLPYPLSVSPPFSPSLVNNQTRTCLAPSPSRFRWNWFTGMNCQAQ